MHPQAVVPFLCNVTLLPPPRLAQRGLMPYEVENAGIIALAFVLLLGPHGTGLRAHLVRVRVHHTCVPWGLRMPQPSHLKVTQSVAVRSRIASPPL